MCAHTLLFLHNDFHTRIIQIAIQQRECVKQLPLSNSAVPLHSCLNLYFYMCLYLFCIYQVSVSVQWRTNPDDFDDLRLDSTVHTDTADKSES